MEEWKVEFQKILLKERDLATLRSETMQILGFIGRRETEKNDGLFKILHYHLAIALYIL